MIANDNFTPESIEIIDRCEKRLQNLHELVEHWLDLARIENGTFGETKIPLELDSILEWSIDELTPLCQRREICIECNIMSPLPKILGDKESLLRVFTNIIGNATKYTPPGGKIKVDAECDDFYICTKISDTGCGIPQDKLPFIFEPFFRVKGKNERQKGSGLGLTFVKKIMEAHDGKIEVTSQVDKGTTFMLKIPRLYEL